MLSNEILIVEEQPFKPYQPNEPKRLFTHLFLTENWKIRVLGSSCFLCGYKQFYSLSLSHPFTKIRKREKEL